MIGLCRGPLLAPEAEYEVDGGFRNHVIFPGGMILEDSGEMKLCYGAAGTIECLATAHVDDLIALCLAGGPRQGVERPLWGEAAPSLAFRHRVC